MKAACFSVAAMDFFSQQNKYYAGGNALNQAIRFAQMGHQSAFIGALGTDNAGDQITSLLQSQSVDISHLYRLDGITACNEIINDEYGERYGVAGAWKNGVYQQFVLNDADWSFISAFDVWTTHANGPNYFTALKRKSHHQLMSVDFLHLKDYELLQKSLEVIDIAYFGGTADMADSLAQIAKMNHGIIVLTLGRNGSIAFKGDNTYTQAALPVDNIVDTTGCGDAFQAGFTAAYYHTKDIQAALLAGAKLGQQAAMHFGGIPWHYHG